MQGPAKQDKTSMETERKLTVTLRVRTQPLI